MTDEPGRLCVGGLLASFRLIYSKNNTTDKGDSPQFVPMAGAAVLPRVKPHIPDQCVRLVKTHTLEGLCVFSVFAGKACLLTV